MNTEQWNRVLELVPDALDLPADQRDAFLDDACTDDDGTINEELRREVAELVAAALEAEEIDALHSPVGGIALDTAESQGLAATPDRVGPWRPVRQLGSGGMGVVFEAVRIDESFKQMAALKIIRPGFVGDFRDRFIHERAMLAGLVHPGIARLLDGGLSEDGTPYLAMELVEGRPLTQYASAMNLSIDRRLELFLQACSAVAYAHKNLVVHRDLKPANIYVHESGEEPVVKLLDFGIAKLLESEDGSVTVTGTGLLTPAYAAPEQLTGAPITTATDVYSLGVVLYELLTDRRPYDLEGKTAAQTEKIVGTVAPKPPSNVAASEWRGRRLHGDLDQIVLKALGKEPGRRYESAQALGDDIRRFLENQPVQAQPDEFGYRLRKFVQRNRTGVSVAAAVFLLINAIALAFTLRLAREKNRASAAAVEALNQAERAQAVSGFLETILRAPNQRWYNDSKATGPDTPVRAVLDEAAGKIDLEFVDRPDIRADLHHILGDTYMALGLTDEAGVHHEKVLRLREALYTPPHPKLAEALYYASMISGIKGDWRLRISRLRRAIDMQRTVNEGNNFPFMIQELTNILINLDELDEAETLSGEALAFVRDSFIPGNDGYRYRDPINFSLFRERAEIEVKRGDVKEGERWLVRSDSVLQHSGEGLAAYNKWQGLQCTWGRLFLLEKRYAEAEASLLACRGNNIRSGTPIDSIRDVRSQTVALEAFSPRLLSPAVSGQTAIDLVELYETWGKPADADPYREEAARYAREMQARRLEYLHSS